jgi:hypothetical protein
VIAALHVAWARGSPFPFPDRDTLADSVVGADVVPSARASVAVASLLTAATALVAGVPIAPRRLRRAGIATVAAVLTVRGVAGLSGRTDLLSPGSTSERFRRLDRTCYSPLCLALAAGVLSTLIDSRRTRASRRLPSRVPGV